MKSNAIVLAYTTFPSQEVAELVCERLVIEGVIACANIFAPMRSIYLWQGKLEKTNEWAAILKTRALKQGALKERIRAVHPYENPCLVFLPVVDGSPEFLQWVSTQSL